MIDARGLSCPEPLVLVRKAMETKADIYEVLVDAKVAMENISKFASSRSHNVEVEESGEDYKIIIRKK